MTKCYLWVFLFTFPLLTNAAGVGITHSESKYFYGGGIGASFGNVDTISLSPLLGVNLNDKTSVGLRLSYVYRNDSRGERNISTNDYGITLFSRYFLTSQFFLEADFEHLNNEFIRTGNTTDRREFNSFLAGGGMRSHLGGKTSIYLTVLYNFSYNDAESPYSDPLSIRGGVGIGF